MKRIRTAAGMLFAMAACVLALMVAGVVQAAETPDVTTEAGASLLADLVRSSGQNFLTAAIGATVVLALFFHDRLGSRGRLGLIGAAVVLTVVAIGATHLGTQDALDHERQLAQIGAQQDSAELEAGHALELDAQERRHDQEILRLNNDLERARLDASVVLATDDTLDRCLDTLKQLQGMTIAMTVTAKVDQPSAEKMAFQIGISLSTIIEQSGCVRPEPETA